MAIKIIDFGSLLIYNPRTMDEEALELTKQKRNDLAYKIGALLQDFTSETDYIVDKMTVNYEKPRSGIVPKDPAVRISLRSETDGPPIEA